MISTFSRAKSVIAASSGNLVEWFDFYIYAFASVYFAHEFSTSSSPLVQQINIFGIFALGFLMRPLGSWLFGSLADKIGRKTSMISSIILMAVGSFMIACLPNKDSVGDFAILFLLVARLIQGLSVGGEYGIAAAYLSEIATHGRRGLFASLQYSTLIGGQLLAVATISVALMFVSVDEMREGAWRMLFVISGILALLSLFIRGSMSESSKNLKIHKNRGELKTLFKVAWRQVLIVIGITAGGSLAFYTITTYMETFLLTSAKLDPQIANNIMLISLFALIIFQPIFGYYSDKVGHENFLKIFACLGILFFYPIFSLIESTQSVFLITCLVILLFFILSFFTSIAGIIKAKFFPEYVRALGAGFGHASANAIFGGSAPFVALQFKEAGFEDGFFIYIAIMLFIVLVIAFFLPKKVYLE